MWVKESSVLIIAVRLWRIQYVQKDKKRKASFRLRKSTCICLALQVSQQQTPNTESCRASFKSAVNLSMTPINDALASERYANLQWRRKVFSSGRGQTNLQGSLNGQGPLWEVRGPPEANERDLIKDGP